MNAYIKDEAYAAVRQELLEWSYGTCQRADGSYYGHPGAVCRKGTEAEKTEEKTPAKTSSGGSTATGSGTAHELSVVKAFGVKLSADEEKTLQENLERGGEKAQRAAETAKQNVADIKEHLAKQGLEVKDVVWTAQLRGDGLAKAAGVEGLNERNNQSDILLKVKDKDGNESMMGVSLKVTGGKYPADIPFYNGGMKGLAEKLGAKGVAESTSKAQAAAREKLGVNGKTAKEQKAQIRADAKTKAAADAEGKKIIKDKRDDLMKQLKKLPPEELRAVLISMTGAPSGAGLGLPTLKVTGYTDPKSSKATKIEDAVDGRVPRAIRGAKNFKVEPTGDAGFKIVADGERAMNVRLKPESQHLVGALKTSGEP